MTDAQDQISYLHFRVGGCDLALEIGRVEEVIRLGQFAEMRRRIPGIDGAIPLHGRVVPVILLSRLLQIEAGEPPMAVVARGRDHAIAFGVNEVIGLYQSPEVSAETAPILDLEYRGVREVHQIDGRIVCCLDLDRVFSEEGWMAIRSLSEMDTDGLLGERTIEILGYD